MNRLTKFRNKLLNYNYYPIRYCSSSNIYSSPYKNSPQQQYRGERTWRLPQSNDDIEKYLMRWENVQGIDFLEKMRDSCIKWGASFSEKQSKAITKFIDTPSNQMRRVNYLFYFFFDTNTKLYIFTVILSSSTSS